MYGNILIVSVTKMGNVSNKLLRKNQNNIYFQKLFTENYAVYLVQQE
jgi:hypothetical protein